MNPVTRWWLVRHAPVINPEGRIHGQLDLEADCGDAPAFEALARLLPAGAVRMVTTLSRTWRTAEAIWGAATDMTVEARLLEQDFGAWQGMARLQRRDRARPVQPAHGGIMGDEGGCCGHGFFLPSCGQVSHER